MKKSQTPIYLALALSIFLLSFFIGRATALKSREESKKNAIYTGRMLLPQKEEMTLPTGAVSEKIEKLEEIKPKEKKETKVEENPPERMVFPCRKKLW